MSRKCYIAALLACCLAMATDCPAAEAAPEKNTPAKAAPAKETPAKETPAKKAPAKEAKPKVEQSVRYVTLDAPAGMSRAVVVQGHPLVYTRQLLPLDAEGKIVGEGSADKQIEQVLDNLEKVLKAGGSGLDKLIRFNIQALSHETADRTRELLGKRLDAAVRPAVTVVLTPLPDRKALVAVDAVAVAEKGEGVELKRAEAVGGDKGCADAALIPAGGAVYVSGYPENGSLAKSAVSRSLSALLKIIGELKLSAADVVRVKVFLTPASSAEEALEEVKKLFPGQLTPPVVFVEWIASMPVEIELVAQLPADKPAENVRFFRPPWLRPSATFSRVALVGSQRQIFISGLSARKPGDGEFQTRDVFEQLDVILAETGSDIEHLAKATYYVSDDDASRGLNIVRPELFDLARPPAASKVTVHGVGQAKRMVTMDMIAVPSGK